MYSFLVRRIFALKFANIFRFNDIPLIYDENVYKKLRNENIDHLLAQHVAHLFIRDTVSLFSEKINQNDEFDTDHFEVSVS